MKRFMMAIATLFVFMAGVCQIADAQSFADQLTWGKTSGGTANAQTITIPNITSLPVGVPILPIPGR